MPVFNLAKVQNARSGFFEEGDFAALLCGWETRSMFDRYNIIDEADLAEAVARRLQAASMAKLRQSRTLL